MTMTKKPLTPILRYQAALRFAGLAALAALALTPLVFDPGAHDDSYFGPKWAWIASWTLLALGAVAARAFTGRLASFPLDEIWIGVLAFTAWHWAAAAWAPSRSLAFERALRVTWLALALWAALQFGLRRRALAAMAWWMTALGMATAVWVLAQDALRAHEGNMPILLSIQIAGFVMLAWLALLVNWRRPLRRRLFVGAALALAMVLIGLLPFAIPHDQLIVSNLADWRGFLAAGLGNTSHIGDLLGLALLPALVLYGEARPRRVRLALFLAALVIPAGLIVSFSVGSNFGLIAGAALMLGLVLARDRGRWFTRRLGRWLVLGAGWAAVIAFFVLPHPLNPHRFARVEDTENPNAEFRNVNLKWGILSDGFGSGRWQAGGPTRLAIWAQSLEMVRRHPILGVGTGNFTYVFPSMDSRLLWKRPDLRAYQGLYTNAAHNELLQQWAELGIVGLFLFLALIGLAFHALLRDIRWCDRPSFLVRITVAGLLAAWLVQAQMNFSFQHPAGALVFFALLLAVIHERRTRPAQSDGLALSQSVGPLVIRLVGQSMTRPTGIGVAFRMPPWLAVGLGALVLVGVAAFTPRFWLPVAAQREYMQGSRIEPYIPAEAEKHFRRALELWPAAQDVRSHYSEFLIRTGQPARALDELKIVRERLNSNELWEREARALTALGRPDEARQAMDTFFKRFWRARMSSITPTTSTFH